MLNFFPFNPGFFFGKPYTAFLCLKRVNEWRRIWRCLPDTFTFPALEFGRAFKTALPKTSRPFCHCLEIKAPFPFQTFAPFSPRANSCFSDFHFHFRNQSLPSRERFQTKPPPFTFSAHSLQPQNHSTFRTHDDSLLLQISISTLH